MPTVDKAEADAEAETQRDLFVSDLLQQYQRLSNVAYPILERSAELCGDKVGRSLEAIWGNKYSLGKDYEAAMTRSGAAPTVTLAATGAGSPLAAAGMMPGDTVVAVNGWPVPDGKHAIEKFEEKVGEQLQEKSTVLFSILTKNGPRDIEVTPRVTCAFAFQIVHSDSVNAHAEKKLIFINTGAMRYLQTDVELATIFGHELAHEVMGHLRGAEAKALVGRIVDRLSLYTDTLILGGTWDHVHRKALESEADYVGLYLMARGGFPVDDAANVWRRFALLNAKETADSIAKDHPPTPERYVLLEKTAAEIDNKIRNGQPLVPEMAE